MSLSAGSDFTLIPSKTSTFTTEAGYKYLNFTYFNYRIRSCPQENPKYSDTKKMCYSECPVNGTYLDASINLNGLCLDCSLNCLSCSNSDNCLTCDANLHLNMTSQKACECDKNSGYINQTSTGLCKLCS